MAAQGQGTGQAGGDAASQAAQQGDAQQGQEAPDFAALVGQVEGLSTGHQETRQALDQIAQGLAGAPWMQQAEQAPEQAPMDVDLSFLDVNDPAYDPQQVAQHLTGLVGQLVQEGVQQHVAPIQEQQAEQRRQWEAAQLTSEFPELSNQETAREVVQSAHQYAEVLAPTIGRDAAQQLAKEPAFWRLMYGMGRSMEAAQQEGSGDPGAAHLEGGGGANPGGGQQVDLGDLIVNGGEGAPLGARALPFHG